MQWRRWKQPKKKLRKRQIQNLGPFCPPWWSSWCHAALFSHSPGTSGKRAALPRRRRNEGTNWTRQKVSLGPRCCEDSNTWSHVWITANDLFGKTIFEKKHVSKSFQPFVSLLSIFLLIQPRGFDSTWNSCIRSSFTQQGGRIGVLMMEANHQKGLVLILIHWFQWWSSLKVISCCLALSEIHCSIRFDLARKRKRPMQLPAASPNFWAQEWIFAVRIFLDYQHRCHHNSSLVQEDVNVFQDWKGAETFQGHIWSSSEISCISLDFGFASDRSMMMLRSKRSRSMEWFQSQLFNSPLKSILSDFEWLGNTWTTGLL